MNTPLVRSRLWALLLVTTCLGACSVESAFKPNGGTPEWRTELAPPDPLVAEPGTLGVRFFCPSLDQDGYAEQLAARIREAAATSAIGPMERLLDRSKKPHYEIVLTEAGSDGKFTGSKEAGVFAGIGGGLTAGLATRNVRVGVFAGLLSGAAGFLGFGTKTDNLRFRVECYQYTSSEGSTRIQGEASIRTIHQGVAVEADTGGSVDQQQLDKVVSHTYFDVKGNRLAWVKFFTITAKGGSFTSASARVKAASETILQHFPSYVFGGTSLY